MEKIANIKVIILAGISMVLFLVASVVYYVSVQRRRFLLQQSKIQRIEHEKEQEILKAIIRAQEEERKRISANLHDSVGVYLSTLQLNLSKFMFLTKSGRADLSELEKDVENLDNAVDTVRSICRDLYPRMIEQYGLLATIDGLLTRLDKSGILSYKKEINMEESHLPSDPQQKLNLLRVLQEVINNILKYSACKELFASFTSSAYSITILFLHDGKVFTNEDASHEISKGQGIGLESIYSRLQLLHGEIYYGQEKNLAKVKITIPT